MESKIKEIIKEEFQAFFEDNDDDQKYQYPEAGRDAPKEVKTAIDRFREMASEDRDTDILLYWLLGSGTPPYKMSKEDSDYVDKSSGEQKCSNCEYLYEKYATGEHICSQIRGKVEPEGWCNLWEEVSM